MALVTGSANASLDLSSAQRATAIIGLLAGSEGIHVGAPCYITGSYAAECISVSGSVVAAVAGFSGRKADFGEPVTLFREGALFQYSSGLTPGNKLYLSTSRGMFDTAETAGDKKGVALIITVEDILITRADGFTWDSNQV